MAAAFSCALVQPSSSIAQQVRRPSTGDNPTIVPLTPEAAFYYLVAVYGAPADAVDRFASRFDSDNYRRALADEFVRTTYMRDTQSKIQNAARNVDFGQLFVFVGHGALGEYDFEKQIFPLAALPTGALCLTTRNPCYAGAVAYFSPYEAVNGATFNWHVPMEERPASEWVRRRTTTSGANRQVAVKYVYSLVNRKSTNLRQDWTQGASMRDVTKLFAFIQSVEIYDDSSMTKRLAALSMDTAYASYRDAREWQAAWQAATTSSTTLGSHRVITGYDLRARQVQVTEVTVSDVGLSWQGSDGQPRAFTYAESFASCHERWRNTTGNGPCVDSPVKQRLVRSDGPWTPYSRERYGIVWDGFTEAGSSGDRIELAFESPQQRGRFFSDLVRALQAWVEKYPALAVVPLEPQELCEKHGGSPRPCAEGVMIR